MLQELLQCAPRASTTCSKSFYDALQELQIHTCFCGDPVPLPLALARKQASLRTVSSGTRPNGHSSQYQGPEVDIWTGLHVQR